MNLTSQSLHQAISLQLFLDGLDIGLALKLRAHYAVPVDQVCKGQPKHAAVPFTRAWRRPSQWDS